MQKIRVAFVKYGGLAAGGTEKFLQTIAANLNKELFDPTYFFCDSAPYIGADTVHAQTDQNRKKYMEEHGIKLVEFKVEAKDVTKRNHPWKNTNFFELFNEKDFDIIQTGRAGHPEYPFTEIKSTPIVDSLHLNAGVDNQFNISRVMHICKWNADRWVKNGGDSKRVVLVSHPMEINLGNSRSLRDDLHLQGKIVFGFHQRNSDDIFSPIPLEAYKEIEGENTHFILMGGSELYKKQAQQLGIKNISFIPHSGNTDNIYSFLQTLDVYAHGRKDGEVNSTAMAEAMYFGLPIISHLSDINNGHVECIGHAGVVAKDLEEYKTTLKKILKSAKWREELSKNAKKRFEEMYELRAQMKNIESIYMDVIKNPFPNKMRRYWTALRIKFYIKATPRVILRKVKALLK